MVNITNMAFEPDKVTNQIGQIRKKPVRMALIGLLSRSPNDALDDEPKTIAQLLALNLVKEAMGFGPEAAKARTEVIDRLEGKPAQAITGGDDDDKPILINLFKRTIVDPLKQSD